MSPEGEKLPMTFKELVGQNVIAVIPIIHRIEFQQIKVLGCEAGGLWVECQALTNLMLKAIGQQVSQKTPIFFLPFQQITLVWTAIDQTSLSESAFGVPPQD
jgi:hypothetical protein